ncbi:MAG: hypothetical protein C4576_09315 [Desulfobacteraceae bacterium]|nr:MAG: hypothetical protein C4576_09315 [Desulfobacteraceae bacterium]
MRPGGVMNSNVRGLVDQLSSKGVPLSRIPACIRDLGSIIAEEASLSIDEMSLEMESRGWENFELDEGTLILVLLFMTETLIESDPGRSLWFESPYSEPLLADN